MDRHTAHMPTHTWRLTPHTAHMPTHTWRLTWRQMASSRGARAVIERSRGEERGERMGECGEERGERGECGCRGEDGGRGCLAPH